MILTLSEEFGIDIVFVLLVVVVVVVCVVLLVRFLRNPFDYPYFNYTFDVSHKRNVDIADYIDKFLCDENNRCAVRNHELYIQQWKSIQENYLQKCFFKKLRSHQYQKVLDDQHAFRFKTVRNQTRYSQRNYVRTPYTVSVADGSFEVDWNWILDRLIKLKNIGFETTLKNYHAKNQRRLMTKQLRKEIMERDHYTCQECGKYMPDEVGLHIDHIIPVSKGGKTVASNLRVLCSKCNGRKGARKLSK